MYIVFGLDVASLLGLAGFEVLRSGLPLRYATSCPICLPKEESRGSLFRTGYFLIFHTAQTAEISIELPLELCPLHLENIMMVLILFTALECFAPARSPEQSIPGVTLSILNFEAIDCNWLQSLAFLFFSKSG